MSPPPVQPVLIKQIDLSELHRGLLSLRIRIWQVLLRDNQSFEHIFCVTQSVDMSPPPVQPVLIKQIDLSELHRGLLSHWIMIWLDPDSNTVLLHNAQSLEHVSYVTECKIDMSELHRGLSSLRIWIWQVLLRNNQFPEHILCIKENRHVTVPICPVCID